MKGVFKRAKHFAYSRLGGEVMCDGLPTVEAGWDCGPCWTRVCGFSCVFGPCGSALGRSPARYEEGSHYDHVFLTSGVCEHGFGMRDDSAEFSRSQEEKSKWDYVKSKWDDLSLGEKAGAF